MRLARRLGLSPTPSVLVKIILLQELLKEGYRVSRVMEIVRTKAVYDEVVVADARYPHFGRWF